MKFSSIILAVFGLTSFVAALPAPAPVADVEVLKARDIVAREPVADIAERGISVNVVADVQVCIDAIVAINKKYTSAGKYTSGTCQSWAAEVVVQIKLLIAVITAYPAGCTYPSIDICVSIFVKLLACIFVQLKVFIDLGGLIGILLLTVDLLLSILLGLVGELLHICVSLCVLIEAKIYVGICAKIISGCNGLIDGLYLSAFVKLCIQAGLKL